MQTTFEHGHLPFRVRFHANNMNIGVLSISSSFSSLHLSRLRAPTTWSTSKIFSFPEVLLVLR